MDHEHYMRKALAIAEHALSRDEFPVGCIVVHDHQIVAVGERINTRNDLPSELDHAEIIALRLLEKVPHNLDRNAMTLYATLEPCLMCFGAVLLSGVGTIVYAYEDVMGGGTACDRTLLPGLYRDNPIRIVAGIGRKESLMLFKSFFANPESTYWRDSLLARSTLAQPM